MRKFSLALTLLGSFALASTATAGSEPVFVRGTIDGAYIRLPHVKPADVTVDMPSPRRLIITADPADFSSGATWPRAEFVEHAQVFGNEFMGGSASRVVLRLTVSNMSFRLEQDRVDTLVILEGATPLRQQWIEARAERRADREAARQAREENRQAAMERQTAPPPPPPPSQPEPTGDPNLDALRSELAATQARLQELEAQLSTGGETAPPPTTTRRAPARRGRNVTARLRPDETMREPAAPPPSAMPTTPAAPMHVERSSDGMVRVPAGRFTMGTPMGYGFDDEVPAHQVNVSTFEIDEREVSVGEFQRSPVPLPRQPDWNWDSDQPVVNVTWREAAQYCEWQGKRLPTEAEWEKAARGSDGRTYPWGNQWSPTRANSGMDGDGHGKASPVGSFALGASPYGALDLSGNVWEWTQDWYSEDYYSQSPTRDPQGPTRGTYRTVRGGSFEGQSAMNVRAAIRMPLKSSARRQNVGFRCAR